MRTFMKPIKNPSETSGSKETWKDFYENCLVDFKSNLKAPFKNNKKCPLQAQNRMVSIPLVTNHILEGRPGRRGRNTENSENHVFIYILRPLKISYMGVCGTLGPQKESSCRLRTSLLSGIIAFIRRRCVLYVSYFPSLLHRHRRHRHPYLSQISGTRPGGIRVSD